MGNNQVNPFDTNWTLLQWQQIASVGHWKVVESHEYPPLPETFIAKANMAYVSLSGNDMVTACLFQAFRVEEKNGRIDEHQYLEIFDNASQEKLLAAFVDHPDKKLYPERTIQLSQDAIDAIAIGGVKAEIEFDRKLPQEMGTIGFLKENNFLKGFETALHIAWPDKKE